MEIVRRVALALVIIGAINWGLIGFFQFDLVATIFGGQGAAFSRVIYALVGLSGIYCLTMLFESMDDEAYQIDDAKGVNFGTEFGDDFTDDFSEDKD